MPVLFALADHDVDGIVQDAPGQTAAQFGHQDVGLGEVAHGHGQGANVVVVAMGDGDGVQVLAIQERKSGKAARPSRLGCMPASISRRQPSSSTSQALAPISESGFRLVMRIVLMGWTGRREWQKMGVMAGDAHSFKREEKGCQAVPGMKKK